jgi:hypothetical protein
VSAPKAALDKARWVLDQDSDSTEVSGGTARELARLILISPPSNGEREGTANRETLPSRGFSPELLAHDSNRIVIGFMSLPFIALAGLFLLALVFGQ